MWELPQIWVLQTNFETVGTHTFSNSRKSTLSVGTPTDTFSFFELKIQDL